METTNLNNERDGSFTNGEAMSERSTLELFKFVVSISSFNLERDYLSQEV